MGLERTWTVVCDVCKEQHSGTAAIAKSAEQAAYDIKFIAVPPQGKKRRWVCSLCAQNCYTSEDYDRIRDAMPERQK